MTRVSTRAGPRPEGMRPLPQAPPGTGQSPDACAVLPHLVVHVAPPGPGNRNQNQGPSRPRAGSSAVVYILQAASASAVDVNRVPRPAGGASGRGAPQSTTGPAPGPRAPSRLWNLAQCAAQIGFEAARRLALKQRRRHLPKAILIVYRTIAYIPEDNIILRSMGHGG